MYCWRHSTALMLLPLSKIPKLNQICLLTDIVHSLIWGLGLPPVRWDFFWCIQTILDRCPSSHHQWLEVLAKNNWVHSWQCTATASRHYHASNTKNCHTILTANSDKIISPKVQLFLCSWIFVMQSCWYSSAAKIKRLLCELLSLANISLAGLQNTVYRKCSTSN